MATTEQVKQCPQCNGPMVRDDVHGVDSWVCPTDAYAYDAEPPTNLCLAIRILGAREELVTCTRHAGHAGRHESGPWSWRLRQLS